MSKQISFKKELRAVSDKIFAELSDLTDFRHLSLYAKTWRRETTFRGNSSALPGCVVS